VAIVLVTSGVVLSLTLFREVRSVPSLLLLAGSWALGLMIYFVVSPLIYQRFHWRPLLYPRCPACKDANRQFRFPCAKPNWLREEVTCFPCGYRFELWYEAPKMINAYRPLCQALRLSGHNPGGDGVKLDDQK